MAQSIVHTLYCNFIENEIHHVRNALLPSTVELGYLICIFLNLEVV